MTVVTSSTSSAGASDAGARAPFIRAGRSARRKTASTWLEGRLTSPSSARMSSRLPAHRYDVLAMPAGIEDTSTVARGRTSSTANLQLRPPHPEANARIALPRRRSRPRWSATIFSAYWRRKPDGISVSGSAMRCASTRQRNRRRAPQASSATGATTLRYAARAPGGLRLRRQYYSVNSRQRHKAMGVMPW